MSISKNIFSPRKDFRWCVLICARTPASSLAEPALPDDYNAEDPLGNPKFLPFNGDRPRGEVPISIFFLTLLNISAPGCLSSPFFF